MQTASMAGSRQRQGLSLCPQGPQLITSCGTTDHWHFVSFLAAQLDPYAANMAPGSQVKHTSRHTHSPCLNTIPLYWHSLCPHSMFYQTPSLTARGKYYEETRGVNSGGVIEVDLWPLSWLTSTSEFARKRSGNVSGPAMRKKIPIVIKCINKNNRVFLIGSLTGDRGGVGRRSHHFTWGLKLSCCSNTKASF